MELLAGEIAAALRSGVVKLGVAKSLSLLFPTAKTFSVVLVGDRNCVVQHENFLQEGDISRAPIPINSVAGHSVVSSVGVEALVLKEDALQSAVDVRLMSQWGCKYIVAVPIPGEYDAKRGSICSLGTLVLGFPQECVTNEDKVRLAAIAGPLSHRVLPLIAGTMLGLQQDGTVGAAFCCACKGVHWYQRAVPLPLSNGGAPRRNRKKPPPSKATADVGGGGGSPSDGAGQQGQSGGLNNGDTSVTSGIGGISVEQLALVLQCVDSATLVQLLAQRQKPLQQHNQCSAGGSASDPPAGSELGTQSASPMRRYNSTGAGSHQQPWHAFGSSGNLQTMSGVASPGSGSPGTIAPSSAPYHMVSSTDSAISFVSTGKVAPQMSDAWQQRLPDAWQQRLPGITSMPIAPHVVSQAPPYAVSDQPCVSTCTTVGSMPDMMYSYDQMQPPQQQQEDGADENLAPAMMFAAWRGTSAISTGDMDMGLDMDLDPFQLFDEPTNGSTAVPPPPSSPYHLGDPLSLQVPMQAPPFRAGEPSLPSGNAMPPLSLGAATAPYPVATPMRAAMHAGVPCQGSSGASLVPLHNSRPTMLQQPNAVPLLGSAVPEDVRAVAKRFWGGQQLQVVLHYLECEEVDSMEVAAAVAFDQGHHGRR